MKRHGFSKKESRRYERGQANKRAVDEALITMARNGDLRPQSATMTTKQTLRDKLMELHDDCGVQVPAQKFTPEFALKALKAAENGQLWDVFKGSPGLRAELQKIRGWIENAVSVRELNAESAASSNVELKEDAHTEDSHPANGKEENVPTAPSPLVIPERPNKEGPYPPPAANPAFVELVVGKTIDEAIEILLDHFSNIQRSDLERRAAWDGPLQWPDYSEEMYKDLGELCAVLAMFPGALGTFTKKHRFNWDNVERWYKVLRNKRIDEAAHRSQSDSVATSGHRDLLSVNNELLREQNQLLRESNDIARTRNELLQALLDAGSTAHALDAAGEIQEDEEQEGSPAGITIEAVMGQRKSADGGSNDTVTIDSREGQPTEIVDKKAPVQLDVPSEKLDATAQLNVQNIARVIVQNHAMDILCTLTEAGRLHTRELKRRVLGEGKESASLIVLSNLKSCRLIRSEREGRDLYYEADADLQLWLHRLKNNISILDTVDANKLARHIDLNHPLFGGDGEIDDLEEESEDISENAENGTPVQRLRDALLAFDTIDVQKLEIPIHFSNLQPDPENVEKQNTATDVNGNSDDIDTEMVDDQEGALDDGKSDSDDGDEQEDEAPDEKKEESVEQEIAKLEEYFSSNCPEPQKGTRRRLPDNVCLVGLRIMQLLQQNVIPGKNLTGFLKTYSLAPNTKANWMKKFLLPDLSTPIDVSHVFNPTDDGADSDISPSNRSDKNDPSPASDIDEDDSASNHDSSSANAEEIEMLFDNPDDEGEEYDMPAGTKAATDARPLSEQAMSRSLRHSDDILVREAVNFDLPSVDMKRIAVAEKDFEDRFTRDERLGILQSIRACVQGEKPTPEEKGQQDAILKEHDITRQTLLKWNQVYGSLILLESHPDLCAVAVQKEEGFTSPQIFEIFSDPHANAQDIIADFDEYANGTLTARDKAQYAFARQMIDLSPESQQRFLEINFVPIHERRPEDKQLWNSLFLRRYPIPSGKKEVALAFAQAVQEGKNEDVLKRLAKNVWS